MMAAIDRKAQFPGLINPDGSRWHYLDTAATAQKPQAVIDAVTRAIGVDYATVHRGVYSRSAQMTLGYEAARRRVAAFIGGRENELVFTRGATEAINLVAHSFPNKRRVLLSQLEHHSNIVPWQLGGWQVDVCPLTADGCIDLDAAEAMLTPEHTMVGLAHVSNVLTLFGPEDSAGIVSFALQGVHPHDLGTILDEENVAIRAGHHCAQPLMDTLGVPATARASFGLYSDDMDIEALVRGIERSRRIFA